MGRPMVMGSVFAGAEDEAGADDAAVVSAAEGAAELDVVDELEPPQAASTSAVVVRTPAVASRRELFMGPPGECGRDRPQIHRIRHWATRDYR
ncbi:unannotated protein [freshwater metagenome]|uniref:Unannotated protein n=1 Tax=freshwater metagenome TaxID=449393 RepID=A0A6J7Q1X2_9ZZZZ